MTPLQQKYSLRSLVLAVSLGMVTSCGGSGSDNTTKIVEPTPDKTLAQLSGQVNFPLGLSGVEVSVGDNKVQTDNNGYFVLSDIEIPTNNRWVVNTVKEDFVATQQVINLSKDKTDYSVALKMIAPDIVKTVDLTQETTVTLNQDQIEITLPAGAVTGGEANSTVSLTYGDPSSARGQSIFPGDYSATNDLTQAPDILLESIAFFDISVSDAAGNDLSQLSQPVDVSLRLPPIYQTGGRDAGKYVANDTIAWWSYNEQQGTWLREDAQPATAAIDDALITEKDGVLFANAAVTHFSWWNVDQPLVDQTCSTVQVLDGNNQPMPYMSVIAQGITYENTYYTSTDAQGYATVVAKQSDSRQEKFKLFAQQVHTRFDYQVTDASEGVPGVNHIYSSSIAASATDNDEANCTKLSNPIIASYKGAVHGVLQDNNGKPIPHYQIYNSFGSTIISDVLGNFRFNSVLESNFSIFVPNLYAKTFTTTTVSPRLDVTVVLDLGNSSPVISGLTVSPSSTVTPGDNVKLIATASDADNDALTYQWQATTGQLDITTGNTVNWTAPSTGSGSADITVTVTDTANNSTNKKQTITWNEADTGVPLIVTAKPWSFNSDIEVAGITVILHGVDGKSIEKTMLTDASGQANFGVIDRDRVTVTLIEQFELPNIGQQTEIDTLVDTLERNVVFVLVEQQASGINNPVFCPEAEQTAVDVSFKNVPNDVVALTIPYGYYNGTLGAVIEKSVTTTAISVKFCDELLSDENYYVIANGNDSMSLQDTPIAHSQAVISADIGTTLTLDMSKSPITIPFINNTQLPITATAISADSFLKPLLLNSSQSSVNSITVYDINSPSYYFLLETEDDNGNGDVPVYDETWIKTELPTSGLVFDLPSFSASNIGYNNTGSSFSWQYSNATAVDGINLQLGFSLTNVNWHIFMSATATNYVLPSLPTNINSKISLADANAQLRLIDFKNITGFDAVIQTVFQTYLDDGSLFLFDTKAVTYPFEIPQE